MARLREFYNKTAISRLQSEYGIVNIMEVPRIEKIVLNMGVGKAATDKKEMELALQDLESIAGQKPVITKAKKSIAGFKIREGWPVGCKVTLRNNRMYEFLDRLITIAIPRIRDFRGLDLKSFDGYGNYSMGIKEHMAFPEIDYDKVSSVRGLDISIITSATNNKVGQALLEVFNFPLLK